MSRFWKELLISAAVGAGCALALAGAGLWTGLLVVNPWL